MKLTYYGHSCFEVVTGGKSILFDPFIRPNELASHIDVEQIDPDYILITHGHADHVADVEEIAKRSGALLVSNFEIINWFASKGVENGHPMNHGGSKKFDFGTVKYVNAVHSSSMPDGSYGGNPGGFVLETDEGNLYHAGDTAIMADMQFIGEDTKIDIALLPIGDNFTMGIEDAIKSAKLIKCDRIVGMHYDTFPPIALNANRATSKFLKSEVDLTLMKIGETITV